MGMIGNLKRVSEQELNDYLKHGSLLENRIYSDTSDDDSLVDLDKSWHGLLYVLTGVNVWEEAHPLSQLLFSGQLIDEEQDLGYGPAHDLLPDEVKYLNEMLKTISVEDLKARFDPAKMNELEIYPLIWDEGEDAFDYLIDGFDTLKNVYETAAQNNEAIISFIN